MLLWLTYLSAPSNRAKMDFVVHPSPPSTAPVKTNEEGGSTRRCRNSRPQSNATIASLISGEVHRPRSRLSSGNSVTPSYLSQRLSLRPSHALFSARDPTLFSAIGRKSRDMTVIDTLTGPRGWYIERCSNHLANGEEVLFEVSLLFQSPFL